MHSRGFCSARRGNIPDPELWSRSLAHVSEWPVPRGQFFFLHNCMTAVGSNILVASTTDLAVVFRVEFHVIYVFMWTAGHGPEHGLRGDPQYLANSQEVPIDDNILPLFNSWAAASGLLAMADSVYLAIQSNRE
jgi:hypothetical protein